VLELPAGFREGQGCSAPASTFSSSTFSFLIKALTRWRCMRCDGGQCLCAVDRNEGRGGDG